MKTQVIAGHTVLTVNWTDEDGDKATVCVLKIGRRVRVTTCDVPVIRECLAGTWDFWGTPRTVRDNLDKNVEVGPKTLARLLEDTLLYGHAKGKVDSDYAFDSNKVAFERAGAKRVRFTAPCGEQGYITNGEAMKLIAALRSL